MSLDVYLTNPDGTCVFNANLTHNLGNMADAAGIYILLWHPEDLGFTTADQLIPGLNAGLQELISCPTAFKKLNPDNGWGSWNWLVPWVAEYLEACRNNPDATIQVSR